MWGFQAEGGWVRGRARAVAVASHASDLWHPGRPTETTQWQPLGDSAQGAPWAWAALGPPQPGGAPATPARFGGVNAAIEVSTTFTVLNADTLPAIFAGEKGPEQGAPVQAPQRGAAALQQRCAHPSPAAAAGCFLYARSFSPTVRHLAQQLAALEGAQAAHCTSSGMSAISATLLALCSSGDHIVASNAVCERQWPRQRARPAQPAPPGLPGATATTPAAPAPRRRRRHLCAPQGVSARQVRHPHHVCRHC